MQDCRVFEDHYGAKVTSGILMCPVKGITEEELKVWATERLIYLAEKLKLI